MALLAETLHTICNVLTKQKLIFMKNYKGYTRKELNTVISNYLLKCIPDTATIQAEYDKEVLTDKDRVNFAMADFERVANYDHNNRKFPNIQDRLADFLQGLPGTLQIDFANYEIVKLAKLWGSIPENATEKTEDKIINNWFNFIAFKFLQLHRDINKVAKTITPKIIFYTHDQILFEAPKKLLNLLVTGTGTKLSKTEKQAVKDAQENYSIPDFLCCDPDYITFENLPEKMAKIIGDLGHDSTIGNGMNRVSFECVEIGKTKYVITDFGIPKNIEHILASFFSDNYKEKFTRTENTWNAFYSIEYSASIAYRGGQGYAYAIWHYTKKNNLFGYL